MKNLIEVVNSEPRVSHRIIAENTSNKAKNINELIKKYMDDFNEFGIVPFETEKLNQGAGRSQITYYLNEQQFYLLMTYLRNSEVVRSFKKQLIKEFFSLKEEINIYQLRGRIGGLTTSNQKYQKIVVALSDEVELLKLQMNTLKALPAPKEKCVLPHRFLGRNALLDFVGAVQKEQQCIKMLFDEVAQLHHNTNYMQEKFFELYPEANPNAIYNKEIHIHL